MRSNTVHIWDIEVDINQDELNAEIVMNVKHMEVGVDEVQVMSLRGRKNDYQGATIKARKDSIGNNEKRKNQVWNLCWIW